MAFVLTDVVVGKGDSTNRSRLFLKAVSADPGSTPVQFVAADERFYLNEAPSYSESKDTEETDAWYLDTKIKQLGKSSIADIEVEEYMTIDNFEATKANYRSGQLLILALMTHDGDEIYALLGEISAISVTPNEKYVKYSYTLSCSKADYQCVLPV